jgi:hypothetical protein
MALPALKLELEDPVEERVARSFANRPGARPCVVVADVRRIARNNGSGLQMDLKIIATPRPADLWTRVAAAGRIMQHLTIHNPSAGPGCRSGRAIPLEPGIDRWPTWRPGRNR